MAERTECPECGGPLVGTGSDIRCTECGLTIDEFESDIDDYEDPEFGDSDDEDRAYDPDFESEDREHDEPD